jgi:uncharacterized tellurite resistance protein B-like protein
MGDTIRSKRLEGTHLIVETADGIETYDAKYLVAAMLIFIAQGSGGIAPEESAKMIDLIREHFQMQGAESLELLTLVMEEMSANPELGDALVDLAPTLTEADKEDIALMALKVIAADGRREVSEMDKFNEAVDRLGISPEAVHRAFDRYFAETMPGLH